MLYEHPRLVLKSNEKGLAARRIISSHRGLQLDFAVGKGFLSTDCGQRNSGSDLKEAKRLREEQAKSGLQVDRLFALRWCCG
jgi:hypothetical protein